MVPRSFVKINRLFRIKDPLKRKSPHWRIMEVFAQMLITVNSVLSGHSKRRQKLVFKAEYRLVQVKSIAECSKREHSAII